MAPTGTLTPATLDLAAVAGADWSATVVLYTDVAQTTPFDLTGYTCTLVIGGGLLTLSSGSGLTITVGTGTIVAALTNTQTTTIAGAQHYVLKLVDGGGLVSYPLSGTLLIKAP